VRAVVLYISIHHGNTEKVAKAMTNALNADLLTLSQVHCEILDQYDLIGFGSGIYFGRHHKSLLDFVDKLPMLGNKKAFIFSTSGLRKIPFIYDFDKPLREKLQRKGFDILGYFSCRGYDTWGLTKLVGGINKGRPNAEDLEQAKSFARRIQQTCA